MFTVRKISMSSVLLVFATPQPLFTVPKVHLCLLRHVHSFQLY